VRGRLAEIYAEEFMSMKSLTLLKQMLPSSAATLALLGLIGIASPAQADDYTLCPNAADQNGSFTAVGGPLDGTACGATDTAVKMYISADTGYARLMWNSTAGLPTVTLGNLGGATANVIFAADDPANDQPYYMLAFIDPGDNLGEGQSGDQILMLEFHNTNLVGNTMAVDPNATEFNLFDNTQGFYLNGPSGGQQDTNTLDGWFAIYSSLSGDVLQQVRIGIGLAGGCGTGPCAASSETLTVNSLDISTVPEPTSILLLGTLLLGLGRALTRKLV
jgi:hypothetical protein